jgi:hypothetical protein
MSAPTQQLNDVRTGRSRLERVRQCGAVRRRLSVGERSCRRPNIVQAPDRSRAVARGRLAAAVLLGWSVLLTGPAAAQELEPRAYSASPVGANFVSVGYQNSWGAVLFDPALPIANGDGSLKGISVGYGRTFGLGGVQALALVGLPYAWGSFSGEVFGTEASVTRSGVADMRAKFAVNLVGSPALAPPAFAGTKPRNFIAGVSLIVSAPTGRYQPEKVVNVGANRWAFKPEAGISYNWRRRWYTDLYGGVWIFSTNSSFYPGSSRRQQDALPSLQAHLSYTLAKRTWAALDGTWFWGGDTHTDGGPPTARMNNKRIGAVLAVGLTPRQSIKLSYSFGASVRVGENFRTAGIAYQLLWF